MDYSPPGSFVYRILQARIWELPICGVSCPPPGDIHDPGIKPESPALAGDFFFFKFIYLFLDVLGLVVRAFL